MSSDIVKAESAASVGPNRLLTCEDVSNSYAHVKDRLGVDASDPEIFAWINTKFLVTDSWELSPLTSSGQFAVERHPSNQLDRGDEDSVLTKQKSIESIGVRPELRSPPWLTQHPEMGRDDQMLSLHWGTLLEGLKRAWIADVNKTNRFVQDSISTKIKGCRVYSRALPDDCAAFLVDYANSKNKDATAISVLQVIRSTTTVEPAFAKKKAAMKWTVQSLGQKELNAKRFEVASALFPNRWSCYTSYERCNTIYKEANKVFIQVGNSSKNESLWDNLHARFKSEVAVSLMCPSTFDGLIHFLYDTIRILKNEPEHAKFIPTICLMTMPQVCPQGVCPLMPDGVPVLRQPSTQALQNLLHSMDGSGVIKDVRKSDGQNEQSKKRKSSPAGHQQHALA